MYYIDRDFQKEVLPESPSQDNNNFKKLIVMKNNDNQGVADYLNNKFGDDFATTEPWMRRPKTDTEYKCSCDAMDDLLTQVSNDEDEVMGNFIGKLKVCVINDDNEQRNKICFVYETIQ